MFWNILGHILYRTLWFLQSQKQGFYKIQVVMKTSVTMQLYVLDNKITFITRITFEK